MMIRKMLIGMTLACGFAASANAMPINGGINFGPGVGNFWAFDGTCSSIADCNGFTLNSPNVLVTTSSGTFAPLQGSAGTMNNVNISLLPVSPVWSVGGFSFTLNNAIIVAVVNGGGFEFLTMTGSGIASGNGYDPTPGTWTFSGDSTDGQFSFSSTNSVRARVPEPGSLALLGLGLIGLGAARRRKA